MIVHVLLALAAVIVVGLILGRLFRYLGQPPVIGEVVAGILLGPSILGDQVSAYILPPAVAPYLSVIAQVGVVLYMFLVGLELNPGLLQSRVRATAAIAFTGMAVPFGLGLGLAAWLYPLLADAKVPFTNFALFMGVALAITAFPVLARILHDRGIEKSELGVLALSCAAIGDVTAWCLLAVVVGVAQAEMNGALRIAGLALTFIAGMFVIVRPLARRLIRRFDDTPLRPGGLAIVLAAVLLAALTTEAIGIHAIFGAFLLGAVLPHDSRLAVAVDHKMRDLIVVLLLPAFFAYTGMRTRIGLVSGVDEWLICGIITLVATIGKFGGCALAGRLTGLDWRTSASLGILMNTRGLMELIVLNIGLEMGIISETLFAMMVLMALATTMATTPLLALIERASQSKLDVDVLTSPAPSPPAPPTRESAP